MCVQERISSAFAKLGEEGQERKNKENGWESSGSPPEI